MAKKELTVAQLEAKKSKLEAKIEEIDELIEEAIEKEKSARYDVISKDHADLITLAKETFKNLSIIESMMDWKDDNPLPVCKDCHYCGDWEVVANSICPLAPICCYLYGDDEGAHNVVEMFEEAEKYREGEDV